MMMNADPARRSREGLPRQYFLLLGGAFFFGMIFSLAIRTDLPVVRIDDPVVVVATSVATLQESQEQEHSLPKEANSGLRVASANKRAQTATQGEHFEIGGSAPSTGQLQSQGVSRNKDLESSPEVSLSKLENQQPQPANDNYTLADLKASSIQGAASYNDTLTDSKVSSAQGAASNNDTLTVSKVSLAQGAASNNDTLTDSKVSLAQGAASDNDTLTDSKASSVQGAASDNHTLTVSKASSAQGAASDNDTLTDSKASSAQGAASDNQTLTVSKASSAQGAASDNDTLTDSKVSSPQGFTGRKPKLADGCWGVYLDVGSNIGVQVRKLFEPERYPNARTNAYFDRIFGTADERRTPGRVCAIGFEANPVHVPRLQGLQKCYNSKGWRVNFVAPRAVLNDDNQTVEFVSDSDTKNKNWGASMVFATNKGKTHIVQTIHLGKFIMEEVAGRLMPKNSTSVGPVYAKFDIEGAEYQTFGGLITTGAVCEITEASIEFHDRYFKNTTSAYLQAKKIYMDFLKLPKTFSSCNVMKMDEMDDESYRQDHKTPVPDGCEKF